jgi:hypothetical protein
MKMLIAIAECPNCKKEHFAKKRIQRRCSCGYWISHVDFKSFIFK